jgi:hypothetical protein
MGMGSITGHETFAYQQLPCICTHVPEISFGMNTSNIGGEYQCGMPIRTYTRVEGFLVLENTYKNRCMDCSRYAPDTVETNR